MRRFRCLAPALLALVALTITSAAALAQDSLGNAPPESPPAGVPSLLGPSGTWHRLAPPPALVTRARHGQSAIFDPDGGRIIEFGGYKIPLGGGGGFQGDLIQLGICGAPGWTTLAASGTSPSPRYGHTAIHDPARKRMLLFGGDTGVLSGELFALSLGGAPGWSALAATGTPPSPRVGHSAIYDPVRDRMIVFGGYDGTSFLNDVWALSLSGTPAWTLLSPSGAPPDSRDYHGAIYDPVRERMVVFGGNNGSVYNDVWALSLSGAPAWTALSPSGAPPSARLAQATIYDPIGDALVIVGGTAGTGIYMSDVWSLKLAGTPAWQMLAPSLLSDGHSRGAVYLPDFRRIVLHGGFTLVSSSLTEQVVLGPMFTTQTLDFGAPPPRDGHVMVLDPARRRVLLHGGETPYFLGDLYEMPLDGPGVWGVPCVVGPSPPGRHGHTAVYDPVRDVVWMHGGFNGSYLGDLYRLSLGTPMSWALVTPSGTPPVPRDYASLVYDPSRDRLVLFGGNNGGLFRNDVWALSLAGTPTWTQLFPGGTPPSPRLAHRAVWDPARDRMIVIGGYDGAEVGDVWALRFSPTLQWVALAPGGPAPSPRHSASLVFDTARDRLVLFGGYDGASRGDAWELPLSGPLAWSPLSFSGDQPLERHGPAGIYDPFHDLMLVMGGFRSQDASRLADSWVLNWGSSATPTLLALASADAGADAVRLVWQASGDPIAVAAVMRRDGDASWRRVGFAGGDGAGRWSFEDREVKPGATYRYALDLGEGPLAEVAVDVPLRPRLSFGGLAPSPAGPGARLVFSLPRETTVRLEIFDLGGRRVASEDLGTLAAGSHRTPLAAASRLAPGVYALKLATGAGAISARATIVR